MEFTRDILYIPSVIAQMKEKIDVYKYFMLPELI